MPDVTGYDPVFTKEGLDRDRWIGGADSLPDDAGAPWHTLSELGATEEYSRGLQPITTGYSVLDQHLGGGFRPETVTILAGRTGSSKSTLAANICRRQALSGLSILFFKLEESPLELAWRMHAATAQVPMRRLLDGGEHPAEDQCKLDDAWGLLRDLPIRIADRRNLEDLLRISRKHVAQGGEMIIIDQLSMIAVQDAAVGYQTATLISNALRSMSRYLHVPVLVVAQINRLASRAKEHLSINDLRDSGAIENDASSVLLVDRIEEPPTQNWQSCERILSIDLIIGKNRYGRPTHSDKPIRLNWYPSICRIEEPDLRIVQ